MLNRCLLITLDCHGFNLFFSFNQMFFKTLVKDIFDCLDLFADFFLSAEMTGPTKFI